MSFYLGQQPVANGISLIYKKKLRFVLVGSARSGWVKSGNIVKKRRRCSQNVLLDVGNLSVCGEMGGSQREEGGKRLRWAPSKSPIRELNRHIICVWGMEGPFFYLG